MKQLKPQKQKLFKKKLSHLKNERGQGMIEYVFLALIIVAILVTFRGQITDAVQGKITELTSEISNFSGGN